MKTVADFEDLLFLLRKHAVRYLIVGGLAFIYHAKPRYTKDMELWVEPSDENLTRANEALAEFGSPALFDRESPGQVIQIGVAPNRIDLMTGLPPADFEEAWRNHIEAEYGETPANWIGLDALLALKAAIAHPRHQEDARVLPEVKRLRDGS